jgi:hypothetical protein
MDILNGPQLILSTFDIEEYKVKTLDPPELPTLDPEK